MEPQEEPIVSDQPDPDLVEFSEDGSGISE